MLQLLGPRFLLLRRRIGDSFRLGYPVTSQTNIDSGFQGANRVRCFACASGGLNLDGRFIGSSAASIVLPVYDVLPGPAAD